MKMNILITGGAGFIGSNLVRHIVETTDHRLVIVDKLTYAGNLASLEGLVDNDRVRFRQTDICDADALRTVFNRHQPDAVLHLAAESHVDRSIDGPGEFIQTNLVGTFNLLQASLQWMSSLDDTRRSRYRHLHVSTDEVFGSLGFDDAPFAESHAYDPHSPYSASKAGSDHLARAWSDTYGLPVIVTNCSNNYGPYQFPEKLIPVVILKAIRGEQIPVYGTGENIRDWLYVEDHARALLRVLQAGRPGETYNIGGNNEQRNIDLIRQVCRQLDALRPQADSQSYEDLITFVEDRPGHDLRYAIDNSKIKKELGWEPIENFESGFRKTIEWYLANESWWSSILSADEQHSLIGTGVVGK